MKATLAELRAMAWRRLVAFFAAPTDGASAAIFRIAFGVLSLVTAFGVALNLDRWFSDDGIMPHRFGNTHLSLFGLAPGADWPGTLHVALLGVGALMMIVGLFPRVGAFVVWLAHTSLQHRTPQILNSGDRLFAIVALLAVMMPLANRFSFHAWLRARKGLPTPLVSSWGLRLLQLQIAYVYANTAMSKAIVGRWRDGRALYDVFASPVFAEWPTWVGFAPLVAVMTWGTLCFEFGFPTLVWLRRLRPWVLLAGIGFHVMIDVLMVIPMFSWIMIVSYAAFLDDEDVARLARALRLRPREETTPDEEPVGP